MLCYDSNTQMQGNNRYPLAELSQLSDTFLLIRNKLTNLTSNKGSTIPIANAFFQLHLIHVR